MPGDRHAAGRLPAARRRKRPDEEEESHPEGPDGRRSVEDPVQVEEGRPTDSAALATTAADRLAHSGRSVEQEPATEPRLAPTIPVSFRLVVYR